MSVPNGWHRVAIQDIYAGLFDGPHATPPPAENGPVFLGIKNISEDGHLNLAEIRHIAEEDFGRWTKRVNPQPGDIVFTYEATLNRYAIIPPGFRGCLGRRLALIRPNVEVVDTRFLHFYFFSQDWRETIEANKLAGATVDRIPLTHFPNFPINLPPLSTQRRIASILSAYDDLIENNTRRIAILEEMARRLYEEWFVHFRFPGHEDAEFIETDQGRVPKGWEQVDLASLMDFKGGAQPPKSEWVSKIDDGYVRMIQIRDYATDTHIAYVRNNKKLRKCEPQDVMIARYGASVGRICWGLEGAYNVALVKVVPTVASHREYLRSALSSHEIQELLIGMSGRAAQAGFNKSILKSIVVTLPRDRELVGKYEEFAVPLRRQTLILKAKNANLRAQRDLLLPKLVSGEIDVSEANMSLEAAE